MLIQHGDVLLDKIESIPKAATVNHKARKGNSLTLAEGEQTGHAHVLTGNAELLQLDEQMFLQVREAAPLVHQEHDELTIPAGDYEVRRVMVFDYAKQVRRAAVD